MDLGQANIIWGGTWKDKYYMRQTWCERFDNHWSKLQIQQVLHIYKTQYRQNMMLFVEGITIITYSVCSLRDLLIATPQTKFFINILYISCVLSSCDVDPVLNESWPIGDRYYAMLFFFYSYRWWHVRLLILWRIIVSNGTLKDDWMLRMQPVFRC